MTKTVLHVIAAPASGGVESYVRDLCIALKSKGWEPHIAFISSAADLGRDASYQAAFLAKLNAAGVGYSHLGHECRRKPWLGLFRLRRLARALGVNLIHSHLAYGNVFAFPLTGVPLIYTHHSERARFSPSTYRLFRQRVVAWIGISRRCAEMLQQYAGQPVHVIRNAVDLSHFSAARVRVASRPLRAISVGRLTEQKNHIMLAQALRRVETNEPGRISVEAFGEGSPEIISQCADILAGCRDDLLRFSGASNNIPKMMSECCLFLMSSSWEGMPLALIEATASGLPAIVTDVGGCREVIEESQSGLIVPPDDVAAFASAIESLLADADLVHRLSQNALRSATTFSIDESARAHCSLYEQVLR